MQRCLGLRTFLMWSLGIDAGAVVGAGELNGVEYLYAAHVDAVVHSALASESNLAHSSLNA